MVRPQLPCRTPQDRCSIGFIGLDQYNAVSLYLGGFMPDYVQIDNSHLLNYIFYPRPAFTSPPKNAFDLFVSVEADIAVSCRFYIGNENWPLIHERRR
jgi:hypothetical protein